jgi:hypothetical protein
MLVSLTDPTWRIKLLVSTYFLMAAPHTGCNLDWAAGTTFWTFLAVSLRNLVNDDRATAMSDGNGLLCR